MSNLLSQVNQALNEVQEAADSVSWSADADAAVSVANQDFEKGDSIGTCVSGFLSTEADKVGSQFVDNL